MSLGVVDAFHYEKDGRAPFGRCNGSPLLLLVAGFGGLLPLLVLICVFGH